MEGWRSGPEAKRKADQKRIECWRGGPQILGFSDEACEERKDIDDN